jgi:thiol-disulfide isomerase/thioredoxin
MNRITTWAVKRDAGIGLLILGFALIVIGANAQNPILEFSFEDEWLTVPLEGSATTWLQVNNSSVYEADAIEISWLSGPANLGAVEPIDVLDPFSEARMTIPIVLGSDAIEGESQALFELSYTYCVADVCFQIIEEIPLNLTIAPASIAPTNGQPVDPIDIVPVDEGMDLSVAFAIALGLGLSVSLIAGKIWGRRWWVLVLLLAILATGLVVGIALDQDQQAQSIGAVLCTSCVGIEEAPRGDPVLSGESRLRIAALSDEIELLLFTATWCHACPYAKAMVQQVIEVNPLVTVQLVDVDVDQSAASDYGIIQSGRTIVPAIFRVDTGEVVFGIEDLETRLLSLLEGSP